MYFCALPFLRLKCHLCHLYILLKRIDCKKIHGLTVPGAVPVESLISYIAPGNNVAAAPTLPEGADTVAGSGKSLYMCVRDRLTDSYLVP